MRNFGFPISDCEIECKFEIRNLPGDLMWGNKLGWGISAALVIVTVGTLVMFEMANSLTPPTAFAKDPASFAVVDLPVAPSALVKMQDGCDAGDLYRQAIDDY